MALLDGDKDDRGWPTDQAAVGGILVAEAVAILRSIHEGLMKSGKKGKARRRRGRR